MARTGPRLGCRGQCSSLQPVEPKPGIAAPSHARNAARYNAVDAQPINYRRA